MYTHTRVPHQFPGVARNETCVGPATAINVQGPRCAGPAGKVMVDEVLTKWLQVDIYTYICIRVCQ